MFYVQKPGNFRYTPNCDDCLPQCRETHRLWIFSRVSDHDDAEDLTQQVCFCCCSGRHKLRSSESFPMWIIRIRSNTLNDYWTEK
ncbi:MAG: hypothetical protein IT210_06210 [Armatimonadetes bacterium]|nr:hypothetical protein [Armatimonadota bacterium]